MKNKDIMNELISSPGFAMIYISCGIKDELKKGFAAKGHDITLDQFSVLIRLWEEDGLSQTDLCQKTNKTKSNLTRILDSMVKKNLITRRVNYEDRRSFNIYLSEKGKSQEIQDDLLEAAFKAYNKIFTDIDLDKKDMLNRTLATILNNLK